MTKRTHHRTLANQLAEWSEPQLATLLERRPDLCHPEPPASVDELGHRAQNQPSVARAIRALTLPATRLLQVVVCLRADAPLSEVGSALPDGVTLEDIEPVLQDLEALALVWRHGGRLHWSGSLVQAMPSKLGPPLRRLVEQQTVDYFVHAIAMLRADIADRFVAELPAPAGGASGRALKADLVDELESLLAVPGLVEAAVEAQEPAARDLARELAAGRPYRNLQINLSYSRYSSGGYYARYPEYQLYERGLFLPARNEGVGYLPREVGTALLGGKPVGDLALTPPALVVGTVDQDDVDRRAGAVAAATLHRLADLLDRWEQAPAKMLKSGGIGVTVMKQVAAALDIEVEQANLLAELLHLAGLLVDRTVTHQQRRQYTYESFVEPSPAASAWLDREPEVRWRQLASVWLAADHWPSATGRRDAEAKAPAVLGSYHGLGASRLRRDVLRLLLELAPGEATAREVVVDTAFWRRPSALLGAAADPRERLGWIVTEAEALGLVIDGALSTFGRALIEGRDGDAEQALAASLPAASSTFTLQADLTAMAVGALEREVLVELRLLADIESTGAATTFRFSETSLRRALDAGRTPGQILPFLERHAAKGVPKPLTFLVNDVARRHGHLQVGTATSFVISEDPAVLADAVSHRKTKKLHLRLLAPTVAVSSVNATKLTEGLRDAGFFPTRDGERPQEVVLTEAADVSHPARAVNARAPGAELPQPFAERPPSPHHRPPPPIDAAAAAVVAKQLKVAPRTSTTTPYASPRPAGSVAAPYVPLSPRPPPAAAGAGLSADDLALSAILDDAVARRLVLGVEAGRDGVDEALVLLPIELAGTELLAIDIVSGDSVHLHLDEIASTIVVGEARDMLDQGPRAPRSKRRR